MKSLLAKLKRLGIDETVFIQDDMTLQKRLASVLRQQAVNHLRNSQDVVARSFRGEYLASGMGHYQDFLSAQAKTGVWATYIEAAALGEVFDCHVVVSPVKAGVKQKPICLYRAANEDAPKIHLYNSDNTHWYVDSTTPTLGDGNCLYNAFSQALKTQVTPELRFVAQQSKTSISQATQAHGFLSPKSTAADSAAIAFQQDIEASIKQHATPAQTKSALQAEKERISRLPPSEQQQIADDYRLALELSRQEMGYAHKNVYPRFNSEQDLSIARQQSEFVKKL